MSEALLAVCGPNGVTNSCGVLCSCSSAVSHILIRAGTGTPEIGGMATWQMQGILRRLEGLNFIGMDVVEVRFCATHRHPPVYVALFVSGCINSICLYFCVFLSLSPSALAFLSRL